MQQLCYSMGDIPKEVAQHMALHLKYYFQDKFKKVELMKRDLTNAEFKKMAQELFKMALSAYKSMYGYQQTLVDKARSLSTDITRLLISQ